MRKTVLIALLLILLPAGHLSAQFATGMQGGAMSGTTGSDSTGSQAETYTLKRYFSSLAHRDTMAIGKKYIQSAGYTFPTFYDTKQSAQMAYGVQAFPTTYFVDADGYLVAWAQGMLDGTSLQKGIDMILGTTEE